MTDHKPQHEEGAPRHLKMHQVGAVPVLRAGSELDYPDIVGKAWPHPDNPNLWYFDISPESGLSEFISLGDLKCFSISCTIGGFDTEAMKAFHEKYTPDDQIKDEVFKAIKFTGKNGAEVGELVRQTHVKIRSGNGWVKLTSTDGVEATYKADSWFLLGESSGELHVVDDAVLRVTSKRLKSNSAARWVLKEDRP